MSCAPTLSPHHLPYLFDLTYTVVLMSLSHGLCTILSYPPSVLSSLSYTAPTCRTSCSHASRFGFGPCFRCILPQIFTTTSVFWYWAIHYCFYLISSFILHSCFPWIGWFLSLSLDWLSRSVQSVLSFVLITKSIRPLSFISRISNRSTTTLAHRDPTIS